MSLGPLRWPIGSWAGTQSDFLARLKSLLPRWFGDDDTPVLDAVLSGPAWVLSYIYQLTSYLKAQLRIATASGGFLDLISADFFGAGLPRNTGETDTAFRARIRANFFPPKNTRAAFVAAVTRLTGIAPTLIEPWNPGDTSAWNGDLWLNVPASIWGSRGMPWQSFVIVHTGTSGVTNQQVYAAIDAVRPAGTVCWVQINTP